MSFDVNERTIGEVILTGIHIVPRYQRPYAWDEENILDLWRDLKANDEGGHFIGNMVVCSQSDDSREIVDGQQRLTTILIALRAIKDAYEKAGEQGKSSGLSIYLQQVDLNGDIQFRLQYRTDAGYLHLDLFAESESVIVGKQPSSQAEKAQYAAYKNFGQYIQQEVDGSQLSTVQCLDKIRDRFLRSTVVYVRVDDRQSAFRIFETLNDRGKSLDQVDLVKNQVISAIPPTPSREEEILWNKGLDLIESSSWSKVKSEDFLGYAWNSTANQDDSEIVATHRIRRSVEAYLGNGADAEAKAREFLRFFNQTAEIFREFDRTLAAPNGQHWKEVVPSKLWRPDKFERIDYALYGCLVPASNLPLNLLFSLLRNYIHSAKPKIKSATLIEFLQVVECLQFRWSIAQRPSTSTIRRAYRRASFAVDSAATNAASTQALKDFKNDANSLMPTDAQFKDGLRRLTYFNQRPQDVHRVRRTLQRIEEHWGSSKLPSNQPMTLEHIEPQGSKSINSKQNYWVGKLGNLMLLPGSINHSLPAKFSSKAPQLKPWVNDKDTELQKRLKSLEWDNSASNSRMESLLDSAIQVWPRQV